MAAAIQRKGYLQHWVLGILLAHRVPLGGVWLSADRRQTAVSGNLGAAKMLALGAGWRDRLTRRRGVTGSRGQSRLLRRRPVRYTD